MTKQQSLFFFAGEQSGDLHGSAVISHLKNSKPDWSLNGVGGPLMRKLGIQGPLKTEDFAIMGFTDVLLNFPRLFKQFLKTRDAILAQSPSGVVLIDYPGFNLRLAKSLRKKGYRGKLIQYISPSVWAHGQGRIETMEKHLDLLLTIYPFENKYFVGTKLPVAFVGNPLIDAIAESHSLASGNHVLALFPGSRVSEVKDNLPIQLEAAEKFVSNHPGTQITISIANEAVRPFIASLIKQKKIKTAEPDQRYALMRECRLAIATSGTVTLELALHKKPTVVTYVANRLNRLIVRTLVRPDLRYFCIVNILANKEVFPELMRTPPTASLIHTHLESLYRNSQVCIEDCHAIYSQLKTQIPAPQMAAHRIEEIFQ